MRKAQRREIPPAQPNAHGELMQRAWQNCREALALRQRDSTARRHALDFAKHASHVAPRHMQRWEEF